MKRILLVASVVLVLADPIAWNDGFSPSAAAAEEARAVLAWIRFPDAEESYAGQPYHWLGRTSIRLVIDVPPQPGHQLEVLWGSKDDLRGAVVTINGQAQNVTKGGYDGFQWLTIRVPEKVTGERYEVTFERGLEKPAFLAEVRLTAAAQREPAAAPAPDKPAFKMRAELSPFVQPEAFAEMRALWDRQPPPPATPVAEGSPEALFRQAEQNARRAAEQFFRCHKFVEGWLQYADPVTGLIPRNLNRDRDIWNAKDAAADNYPYMVLTCSITDRPRFEGRMLQMLRTETKLTSRIDRLPDTWSFSKQAFQTEKPNLDAIIFGGAEYVKDGLIPLTEWLGPSPWSERMVGILDDLWKHATVDTPFGKIPTTNVEVNGDLLQALSRTYWFTGDPKYLDYAIRLGDYYLLGDKHPTRDFTRLKLRDHGCEVVAGLSELYAAVHFARPEKKQAYREPIHAIFDRILEVGRREDGMLYNTIDPRTGEHDKGICDTWGYNYNAIYTVYLLDKTEDYRTAVEHVLSNLKEHLTDYHWGSADEYADSIEGAINLYNRVPVASAAEWIDGEINDMWRVQRPDGVVEGWHGDGNSARTAIMYALWKTQGLTVRPWRADVRVGAVEDDGILYVSLAADEPWRGTVLFDKPRHKVQMHLPIDYPRINQFPEWFTADAAKRYTIVDTASGEKQTLTGLQLQEGVPVELKPGQELRWTVRLETP